MFRGKLVAYSKIWVEEGSNDDNSCCRYLNRRSNPSPIAEENGRLAGDGVPAAVFENLPSSANAALDGN